MAIRMDFSFWSPEAGVWIIPEKEETRLQAGTFTFTFFILPSARCSLLLHIRSIRAF